MPWVEFHATTITRLQKFRELRADLGWSVNETLGMLGHLWGQVMELREDGDIRGWTPDYLASLIDVRPNSALKLWEALANWKWIELKEDGCVLVHDWIKYAGTYLVRRYKSHRRDKLVEIWAKHGLEYGAYSAKDVERENNGLPMGSLPNLTIPNQTVLKMCARPSLEQVRAYCAERKNSVDPEKWFAYYESNGWKVGRNPMKNWQAAVRTWEKNAVMYGARGKAPANQKPGAAAPIPGKYGD